MIVPDPEKKLNIRNQLKRIPNLYITGSESYYIELAAGSVSKASALQALTQTLHITPENIIAFGDGANDIELLAYAGHGVAMKNSAPSLLEAADAVTLSNDEDGVAHAIQRYALAQALDCQGMEK